MPNAESALAIYSPSGAYLPVPAPLRIDCVLSEMQVGGIEVTFGPDVSPEFFQRDGRIAFFRKPASDIFRLTPRLVGNTVFLIQRRRRRITTGGDWRTIVTAVHPNHLLNRRVVAYDEGTSQAEKTDLADDMMKDYVRENFTAATDTTRNWSSSLFTVHADTSSSTTVRVAASYKTVLGVLQEIAAQAATEGTYTGFETFSATEAGAMTFRTYTGQRGVDRGQRSPAPLILSMAFTSLSEMELDIDWTNAPTYVYASGRGIGDERTIGTREDTTRSTESPYGRYEWFTSQAQTEETLMLEGVAARRLRELRPRKIFTGKVVDTEYATFGEEYDWGDMVVGQFVAAFSGSLPTPDQFDCRVDPVRITVERVENKETGIATYQETLDIRLRGEL